MKIAGLYLSGLGLVLATYILGALIFGVVGVYLGGIGIVIFSLFAIANGFKTSTPVNAVLFAVSCSVLLISVTTSAAHAMSFAAASQAPIGPINTTADLGWSGAWRVWADLTAAGLEGVQQLLWMAITMGWLFGGAIWSFKAYEHLIEHRVDAPNNFFHALVIAAWGLTGGSFLGWLLGSLTWVAYDFVH